MNSSFLTQVCLQITNIAAPRACPVFSESLFLVVRIVIHCLKSFRECPTFAEEALASCVLGTCATERASTISRRILSGQQSSSH
jgi:hypothetical protein